MPSLSKTLLHTTEGPLNWILFALPEEEKPFRKMAKQLQSPPVILRSGVGARNAARIAGRELAAMTNETAILVVCGFAGGLSKTSEPGSLVIANRIIDESGEFDSPENYAPDSDLMRWAESVHLSNAKTQSGTLVTVDKVLTKVAEKRELAERTGAIAVDMETAGAVRVAEARGIPWLAVRAITDGVSDELPLDFNALANPDGSINHGRILRATLTRPHKIPALIRLGQRSSLAANNLAAFLTAFLQTLPETNS